jgi:hypothetical protein
MIKNKKNDLKRKIMHAIKIENSKNDNTAN